MFKNKKACVSHNNKEMHSILRFRSTDMTEIYFKLWSDSSTVWPSIQSKQIWQMSN